MGSPTPGATTLKTGQNKTYETTPLILGTRPGATTLLRRVIQMANKSNRSVASMVDEVLARQAEARAARNGESFEEALKAVLGTEAGRQLRELGSGSHRHERADEWQENIAQERAEERAARSRGPLPGEAAEPSTDG